MSYAASSITWPAAAGELPPELAGMVGMVAPMLGGLEALIAGTLEQLTAELRAELELERAARLELEARLERLEVPLEQLARRFGAKARLLGIDVPKV